MDLELLRMLLKDYRIVLSRCDEIYTIGRITQLKSRIKQIDNQINIIERWEKQTDIGSKLNIANVTHRRELFDNFYKWYDSLTVAESDEHSLTSAIETYFFKIIK